MSIWFTYLPQFSVRCTIKFADSARVSRPRNQTPSVCVYQPLFTDNTNFDKYSFHTVPNTSAHRQQHPLFDAVLGLHRNLPLTLRSNIRQRDGYEFESCLNPKSLLQAKTHTYIHKQIMRVFSGLWTMCTHLWPGWSKGCVERETISWCSDAFV